MLNPRSRTIEKDKNWDSNVSGADLSDHVLERVSAKDRAFTKVNFAYTRFVDCYFRKCTFIDCDFTGCKFSGTNLRGSRFSGCDFSYSTFEKTFVDPSILDNSCPSFESLTEGFAQTLRMNYQSLGDTASVNKAILVELRARRDSLHKAWRSPDSYNRQKYGEGLSPKRIGAFLKWFGFRFLDLAWGNGESWRNLAGTTCLLLAALAAIDAAGLFDTSRCTSPRATPSFSDALIEAPQIFLGTKESCFPGFVTASITFIRLVIMGLFMSILIRRLQRR